MLGSANNLVEINQNGVRKIFGSRKKSIEFHRKTHWFLKTLVLILHIKTIRRTNGVWNNVTFSMDFAHFVSTGA